MTLLATIVALAQNPARVDFSLRSIDGQTVTSDSLRGEIVVLAFGASWLPLSRTQLQGVRKLADEVRLLGVAEMQRLFPDCEIHRERVFGLVKSLIAVRRASEGKSGVA